MTHPIDRSPNTFRGSCFEAALSTMFGITLKSKRHIENKRNPKIVVFVLFKAILLIL